MNIYFARHGQTDWNVLRKVQGSTDIPLNEEGIKQAKQLCQTIIDENINPSKIYTSYQCRALKTAQIISEQLGVDCEILNGLEEMNLGDFEGHTWDEIQNLYPKELQSWHENKRYNVAPNGESYQMVIERLFKALESVIDFDTQKTEGNILFVTHGAVIMTLIAIKHGIPFEQSHTIEIENAKPIAFSIDELIKIKNEL